MSHTPKHLNNQPTNGRHILSQPRTYLAAEEVAAYLHVEPAHQRLAPVLLHHRLVREQDHARARAPHLICVLVFSDVVGLVWDVGL